MRRWVRKGVENTRSIVDSAPVLCHVISPHGRRRFRPKELTISTSELASLSAEMCSPPQEGWWRLKSPRRITGFSAISGLFWLILHVSRSASSSRISCITGISVSSYVVVPGQ